MERIQSVDVFRLFAIIAVIVIHTTPFRVEVGVNAFESLELGINVLARFGVPFFFIISGYFWGVKIRKGSNPLVVSSAMTKRLIVIFLAWCAIYLLPYNVTAVQEHGILGPFKYVAWTISGLIHDPLSALMQGTKIHLWFLVGLLFSLIISTIFIYKKWIKSLVVVAIALYVFGVLAKSYALTPIGLEIEFNTRNGPFFGTIFFVTGYILSGRQISTRWLPIGAIIFAIGSLIHLSELIFLSNQFSADLEQDYVFGTYLMGLGVSLVALSNHSMLRIPSLSRIGQLTLGIYAIHFIFVDLFATVDQSLSSPIWELGYVLIVLLLSIMSVLMLVRIKSLQRIMA